MKLYQVDVWDHSPFDLLPTWHKIGTYDLETARKVLHDPDIYRLTACTHACIMDTETGEVVEEFSLPSDDD